MTEEEKELLVKDLCARLPYGVIVQIPELFYSPKTIDVELDAIVKDGDDFRFTDDYGYLLENIKPYLRPLSSITVEEICKIEAIIGNGFEYTDSGLMVCSENVIKLSFPKIHELMEFLYQRHIDVNGFIPMGLALPATEDMYK